MIKIMSLMIVESKEITTELNFQFCLANIVMNEFSIN